MIKECNAIIACKRRTTKDGRQFNSYYGKNNKGEPCTFKFLNSPAMERLKSGVYDVTFMSNKANRKDGKQRYLDSKSGEYIEKDAIVYYVEEVVNVIEHIFDNDVSDDF